MKDGNNTAGSALDDVALAGEEQQKIVIDAILRSGLPKDATLDQLVSAMEKKVSGKLDMPEDATLEELQTAFNRKYGSDTE